MTLRPLVKSEDGELSVDRETVRALLHGRIEREMRSWPRNATMSEDARNAAIEGGLSTIDTIVQLAAHHFRQLHMAATLTQEERKKVVDAECERYLRGAL